MLRIGLTGGMGCGKSTIARTFSALGIATYDADTRAKAISAMESTQAALKRLFGEEAARNRKILAGIVFNDPEQLARLNRLLHPLVLEDCRKWFETIGRQPIPPPYAVAEAAILFESGMDSLLDFAIVVEAPEEDRIERCLLRDRCGREEILARFARQMPEAARREKADFLIRNGKNDTVLSAVLEIDQELRMLSKSKT